MDDVKKRPPEASAAAVRSIGKEGASDADKQRAALAAPHTLHIIGFDSMPAMVERMRTEEARVDTHARLLNVLYDPSINGFCAVIRAPENYKPLFANEAKMMVPDNQKIVMPS